MGVCPWEQCPGTNPRFWASTSVKGADRHIYMSWWWGKLEETQVNTGRTCKLHIKRSCLRWETQDLFAIRPPFKPPLCFDSLPVSTRIQWKYRAPDRSAHFRVSPPYGVRKQWHLTFYTLPDCTKLEHSYYKTIHYNLQTLFLYFHIAWCNNEMKYDKTLRGVTSTLNLNFLSSYILEGQHGGAVVSTVALQQ